MTFKSVMRSKGSKLAEIEDQLLRLEMDCRDLRNEKTALSVDLTTLKHKHKLEKEDLEHLVKLKTEQLDIEYEKKVLKLERVHAAIIRDLTKQHHVDIVKMQNEESDNMREIYKEILGRLPDITAHFGGGQGKR